MPITDRSERIPSRFLRRLRSVSRFSSYSIYLRKSMSFGVRLRSAYSKCVRFLTTSFSSVCNSQEGHHCLPALDAMMKEESDGNLGKDVATLKILELGH